MKKVLSIALALLLVIGLVSFAKPASADAEEITLWTYPIGNWGNEETVKALTDAFTAETGIKVKVEYLRRSLTSSGRGGWPPPRTGPPGGTVRPAGRAGSSWPPPGTPREGPALPPPEPYRRPCRS